MQTDFCNDCFYHDKKFEGCTDTAIFVHKDTNQRVCRYDRNAIQQNKDGDDNASNDTN